MQFVLPQTESTVSAWKNRSQKPTVSQLERAATAQAAVEKRELLLASPADQQRENASAGLQLGFGRISAKGLSTAMTTGDPGAPAAIAKVADIIRNPFVNDVNEETFSLSIARIREHFVDAELIANDAETAVLSADLLLPGGRFTDEHELFAIFAAFLSRSPADQACIHAANMGLKVFNHFRDGTAGFPQIPNFAYTYTFFTGSPPIVVPRRLRGAQSVGTWCATASSDVDQVTYTVTERVAGESLECVIANWTNSDRMNDLFEIVLSAIAQVTEATRVAYKHCNYTHFNLDASKVFLVEPYDHTTTWWIDYGEDDPLVRVVRVAMITDYRTAHATIKGRVYGATGTVGASVSRTSPSPVRDLYTLIASALSTPVLSTGLSISDMVPALAPTLLGEFVDNLELSSFRDYPPVPSTPVEFAGLAKKITELVNGALHSIEPTKPDLLAREKGFNDEFWPPEAGRDHGFKKTAKFSYLPFIPPAGIYWSSTALAGATRAAMVFYKKKPMQRSLTGGDTVNTKRAIAEALAKIEAAEFALSLCEAVTIEPYTNVVEKNTFTSRRELLDINTQINAYEVYPNVHEIVIRILLFADAIDKDIAVTREGNAALANAQHSPSARAIAAAVLPAVREHSRRTYQSFQERLDSFVKTLNAPASPEDVDFIEHFDRASTQIAEMAPALFATPLLIKLFNGGVENWADMEVWENVSKNAPLPAVPAYTTAKLPLDELWESRFAINKP